MSDPISVMLKPHTITSEDTSFTALGSTLRYMSPPELTLPPESDVLRKFVMQYGFSKGIIAIYDHWITTVLPRQIEARHISTPTGTIYFSDVRVTKPVATTTGREPLTSQQAQKVGQSYLGTILAKMRFVPTDVPGAPPQAETVSEITFSQIPVMLGSQACYLSTMTDDQKAAGGECPNDPLGYFIIGGTPKVITIQEKLRTMMYHTFLDVKGNISTRMTCPTVTGTTVTSLVVGKKLQTLRVGLQHLKREKHLAMFTVYHILMLDYPTYQACESNSDNPQYQAYMGVIYNQLVIQILQFCKPENHTQVIFALQSSIARAMGIRKVIDYIAKKRQITKIPNPEEFYTRIRQDIFNDLFSHVPAGTAPQHVAHFKVRHLAFMAANTIKHLLGLRGVDDRDSWGNKRLDTAARSMEQLFNGLWSVAIEKITEELRTTQRLKEKSLHVMVPNKTREIGTHFVTSFQPGNWGVKHAHNRENITDSLKRETPMAIYSQIGRINTPSARKAKSTQLRMIQPSQLGYICLAESPEGENLGLLKNLGVTTIISMERDPRQGMSTILANPNYTRYIADEYQPGYTPVLLAGVFQFWALPALEGAPKDILGRPRIPFELVLLENRRNGVLPADSCIFFNTTDSILEYYCDGGRPCRPLFVAAENGELLIDQLGLWNSEPDELLRRGCVEFVDAREQEYTMLAMSVDDVRKRFARNLKLTAMIPTIPPKRSLAIERAGAAVDRFAGQKGDVIVGLGKVLFTYFEAVRLKTKATSIDGEAFLEGLVRATNMFYRTLATAAITGVFEDEDLGFDKLGVLANNNASRYVLDTIDVHKRKYSIDPKHLRVHGHEDSISSTFIGRIDVSVDYEAIIQNVIDKLGDEFRELQRRIPFTHSEIDPVAIFGIAGSLEPQPNCGQGPRSTYQASMCKQALGMYHYNHHLRFDTGFKILLNPSRPMFETVIGGPSGLNSAPTGTTPICAFLALTDNNEDAQVVKREFIEACNLDICKFSTYRAVLASKPHGGATEAFRRPDPKPGETKGRYAALLPNGLPRLDALIRPGDAIIGKVQIEGGVVTNTSIFAGVGSEGYVDRVIVLWNTKNEKVVKVKLRQTRKHGSGDKLASRYAQKGTISRIIPEKDLPCIVGGPSDGLVPDFFLNPHCFPAETLVDTFGGLSRKLISLPKEGGAKVMSWDGRGLVAGHQVNMISTGVKSLCKITLSDGRTIRCTPSHPFMCRLPDGTTGWVRAGHLIPSYRKALSVKLDDEPFVYSDYKKTSKRPLPSEISQIVCGIEMPEDVIGDDEADWTFTAGDLTFSMSNDHERNRSMAFARLLGYMLTDGTLHDTGDKYRCNLSLGHRLDCDMVLDDIELLTNRKPAVGRDGGVYVIGVPTRLAKAFVDTPGIQIGRRVEQEPGYWPHFLYTAPKAVLREFVAGLFGGDGHAPGLVHHKAQNRKRSDDFLDFGFASRFSLSIVETYVPQMQLKMSHLVWMLEKLGVEKVRLDVPKINTSQLAMHGPRAARGEGLAHIPRHSCMISILCGTSFATKVGFRYCVEKMSRLAAANAYFRYIETIKSQHNRAIERVTQIRASGVKLVRSAIDLMRSEIYATECPMNQHYSFLNRDLVGNRARASRKDSLERLDYRFIATPEQFLRLSGTFEWFRSETSGHSYVITHDMDYIPTFSLMVLDVVDGGMEEVFDIEVANHHAFTSKGLVVSNCIASRMTCGKLKEIKASKAALYTGERIDATCFHTYDFDGWTQKLVALGMDKHGDEAMMWPSGKVIDDPVFVGPCYYQCLRHHIKDKVQCRSRGSIKMLTHQPVGGRDNLGGLRVGEMERDGLIGHAASGLVLERLMLVSDAYKTVFCSNCGNIAIADVSKRDDPSRSFVCRICDTRGLPHQFVSKTIPYVLKLMFHMLLALNINVTLHFAKSVVDRLPPDHPDAKYAKALA